MLWMFIAVTRLYPFPSPPLSYPTQKKKKKTPHSFDLVEPLVYCNGLLLLRIVFCRLVYLPPRFGRWGRRLNLSNNFTTSLPPFLPLASSFPSFLPAGSIHIAALIHPPIHPLFIRPPTHPHTIPKFQQVLGYVYPQGSQSTDQFEEKKRPGIYCDTMIIILPLPHLRTPPISVPATPSFEHWT